MTRQLNYPGNCIGLEGQIVGPTLLGQLLVITATFYDAARNVTEAFTRPATVDEVEAQRASVTPPGAFTA